MYRCTSYTIGIQEEKTNLIKAWFRLKKSKFLLSKEVDLDAIL